MVQLIASSICNKGLKLATSPLFVREILGHVDKK
jgi:hypothetical protein